MSVVNHEKSRFLILANMQPESHFLLRREPAIRRALHDREFAIRHIWEPLSEAQRGHLQDIHPYQRYQYFAKLGLDCLNEEYIQMIEKDGSNVVIFSTIHDFKHFLLPRTLLALQKQGKYVVGVLGDEETPEYFHEYKFWLPLFDAVVVYTKMAVDAYQPLSGNVMLLPEAADMFVGEDVPANIDESRSGCVFVGSVNPVREKLLELLVERGVEVSIYGHKRWLKNAKLRQCYKGYIPNAQYDSVLRKYSILLGFMEDGDGNIHVNAKLGDAARNECFLISSYYAPFLEEYGLVEGEEIVMYRSPEDLVEKVEYYLTNPAERQKIAQQMAAKIRAEFDYTDLYRHHLLQLEAQATTRSQNNESQEAITFLLTYPSGSTQARSGEICVSADGTYSEASVYHRDRLEPEYDELLPTKYIISGAPDVQYDPALGWLVSYLSDNFPFERAVFHSYSSSSVYLKSHFLADTSSVIWAKEYFRSKLSKYSRRRDRATFIMNSDPSNILLVPLLLNKVDDSLEYSFLFRYLSDGIFFWFRSLRKLRRLVFRA